MTKELSANDKHLLRLIRKDKGYGGWTKVSGAVWPLVQSLPSELVELKTTDFGHLIRLTEKGDTVLDWC